LTTSQITFLTGPLVQWFVRKSLKWEKLIGVDDDGRQVMSVPHMNS